MKGEGVQVKEDVVIALLQPPVAPDRYEYTLFWRGLRQEAKRMISGVA